MAESTHGRKAPSEHAAEHASPEHDEVREVTRSEFLRLFTAVMLPMFLAVADQTLLATATPVVAAEFGQIADTSWIATAYLLTNAVMVTVYGRLGDSFGRREMLFAAMGVFVVGSIVCAAAPSLPWLIAGRAIQGAGGGGLMSLSQALIGELVPPRQRIRFQGYFAIIFTVANILGPVIGGLVVSQVSWRWLFVGQLPLTAFAAWRLFRLPRGARYPDAPGVSDVAGLVMFAVGTTLLLFGASSAGHRFAWLSVWTLICFAGGAAIWVALLRHESRHRAPFFPIDLVRIRALRLAMGTMVCNTACMYAMVFYLPIYLQLGMRLNAGHSGLLVAPLAIGMIIGGQGSIRIAARIGKLNVVPRWGLTLACVALLGLALLPPHQGIVIALGFLAGVGLGPTMPSCQILVQHVAGRQHLGAATALVSLSRTSGAALGTAVTGALIFSLLPDMDVGQLIKAQADTAESLAVLRVFHIVFFSVAGAAALGAWIASRIPTVKF